MTPIRSTFRDELRDHGPQGRFYYWQGDGPFISVTNALSQGMPKPQLMYWSAKMVAEYVSHEWDDATEMRSRMDRDEFTKFLKNKPWRARDKAGDIGTLIHDVAEALATDSTLPDMSSLNDEGRAKVDQYIDFIATVDPEFHAIEGVVFNRKFGYAGAFDMIVDIDHGDLKGRWIIDIKTGSGVYAEAALQQTAYRYAEFIGVGDDEIPMPAVDGALILHLQKTQWKLIPVDTSYSSWHAFRAALHVAKWRTGKGEGYEDHAVGRAILKGRS